MKVDYVILACALLVFILCLASTLAIIQIPEPTLRVQLFFPLMLLLGVGVALVVLFGVMIGIKGAIAKSQQKT